jgi:hypothetical protein
MTAVVCALISPAVVAAAIKTERFSGQTSQRGDSLVFDVVSSQVKNALIGWTARCHDQEYSRATGQSTTRITIRHNRWSSTGSYRAKIAGAPRLTGHFPILEFRGLLKSSRLAVGTFHLRLRIYNGARAVDSCDTGRITWRAISRG